MVFCQQYQNIYLAYGLQVKNIWLVWIYKIRIYFFLQYIIVDFFNFTKILGQNLEISNTNLKSFHFHYWCVCCYISLFDNSLHSSPFGANFEKEIFDITAFWPNKNVGGNHWTLPIVPAYIWSNPSRKLLIPAYIYYHSASTSSRGV